MELPKRPYLRPPTDPHDAARRAELIARAIAQRDEILTYFATVDHWNRVRQPDELPIDPDPDGSMRDWLRYYNALIAQAVT